MIQQELDKFEKLLLTDVFGGYSANDFIIGKGFMSYNVSGYVQKYIKIFETIAKKHMDIDGNIVIPELNIKAKPSEIYLLLKGQLNDTRGTTNSTPKLPSWFNDTTGQN